MKWQLFILGFLFLVSIATANAYTSSDIFKNLTYNYADFGKGEAHFSICNPLNIAVNINTSIMNSSFIQVKGNIKSYYWEFPNNLTWAKNECKTVKLFGTYDMSLSEDSASVSIDWQPEIKLAGTKYKHTAWAWWNTSYSYNRPVNFTNSKFNTTSARILHYNFNTSNKSIDPTCYDIQVTNIDSNVSYPYYRETCNASGITKIDFAFSENCSTISPCQFRIYYGNSTAVNDGSNITFASEISDLAIYQSFSTNNLTTIVDHSNKNNFTSNSSVNGIVGYWGNGRNWSGSLEATYSGKFNSNIIFSNNVTIIKFENYISNATFTGTQGHDSMVAEGHSNPWCTTSPASIVYEGKESASWGMCGYYYNTDQWYYMARVISNQGSTSEQRAYKDNSLWVSKSGIADTMSSAPYGLGFRTLSSTGRFSNDEFQVYYKNMTLPEINFIYDTYNQSLYSIGAEEFVYITPQVNFTSQVPADIKSTNLFSTALNITYNITGSNLNYSTPRLYFKTNTSTSNIFYYINGSATSGYLSKLFNSNSSEKAFNFLPGGDNIYPGTHNIDPEVFDNTIKAGSYSVTSNNIAKIELLNVSNSTNYSYFEVMANTSDTGQLKTYYCNSSYTSGNPAVSTSCILFNTISATGSYNHTHVSNSKHQIMPMAISNGSIGNVRVTSRSYFILDSAVASTTWKSYYISNNSRTGAIQVSANNGNTWTNVTYTIDAHLHQWTGNENFYQYACVNNTTNSQFCSTITSEGLELDPIAPTSPAIITPINSTYSGNLVISYFNATSPTGQSVLNYTIDLLETSGVFNSNIVLNNYPNNSYNYNTSLVSDGAYLIRITATDNLSLSSFSLSEVFTINNAGTSATNVSTVTISYLKLDMLSFDDTWFWYLILAIALLIMFLLLRYA